jgi:hypothetical protein
MELCKLDNPDDETKATLACKLLWILYRHVRVFVDELSRNAKRPDRQTRRIMVAVTSDRIAYFYKNLKETLSIKTKAIPEDKVFSEMMQKNFAALLEYMQLLCASKTQTQFSVPRGLRSACKLETKTKNASIVRNAARARMLDVHRAYIVYYVTAIMQILS